VHAGCDRTAALPRIVTIDPATLHSAIRTGVPEAEEPGVSRAGQKREIGIDISDRSPLATALGEGACGSLSAEHAAVHTHISPAKWGWAQHFAQLDE
jgi:hypothetical protein